MPQWNAQAYLRFERERTQAVRDLIARLETSEPVKILDVGCGPGNSTAALARRFPKARVVGIDSSADMLEAARRAYGELIFLQCDAGCELERAGEDYDLVFSNACIHWIPGQEGLLRGLLARLRPGGELAVQLPLTERAPFYKELAALSAQPPWNAYLAGAAQSFHSLSPEAYFDLLDGLCDDFSIWETTYLHPLPDPGQVLEWYRGSGLRPYLQALPAGLRPDFERELYGRLERVYPVRAGGKVILPMTRLFFTARR